MQRRHLLGLPVLAFSGASKAQAQASGDRVLTRVDTGLGSFVIEVDKRRAPITVANYLAYVDGKLLDGGSVYRVVTPANQTAETAYKIEVVQWGTNAPDEKIPPLPPISHETTAQTGLLHRDGVVSMARDAPGTATSEFFICIGDQPELDFGGRRHPDGQGFAAFGRVVSGRSVVMALYRQGSATDQYLNPPIAVRSVRRLTAREAAALAGKS